MSEERRGEAAAPERGPARRPWIFIPATAAYLFALAAVVGRGRILSQSVDSAHHLQMADFVRRNGLFSTAMPSYLGEFGIYPKLSHALAAALMSLGVGPLQALVFVAVFSAAACWLGLLYLAGRVGRTVLAVAGALALTVAWRLGAVVGAEVVNNFFYAQLVSEAACVAGLLAGGALVWRSRPAFAAWAPIATYVTGWMHAVGALHLALALMALALFVLLRTWRVERRWDPWSAAALPLTALALLAAPSVRVMSKWAENPGSLVLRTPLPLGILDAYSATLLVLSGVGLLQLIFAPDLETGGGLGRRERAAAAILAFGAAVGAAGAAQGLTHAVLHLGSPYTVQKHAFAVFSAFAVAAPTLGWLEWRSWQLRAHATASRFPVALLVAVHLALLASLLWRTTQMDVAGVDRLLIDLRAMRPAAEAGGHDYLFADSRMPPVADYMGAVVGLRADRDDNALSVLFTGRPVDTETVANLVTDRGDPVYDTVACRRPSQPGPLVTIDGACAVGPRIEFKSGGAGAPLLREGWSVPEVGGVWSIGRTAALEASLPAGLPPGGPATLQIGAFAYLPAKHPTQAVTIRIDGGPPLRVLFDSARPQAQVFVLRLAPSTLARGRAWIEFQIADPVSPHVLGLGADRRTLGLGLAWLRILPGAGPLSNTDGGAPP